MSIDLLLPSFLAALVCSAVLVLTQRWHGALSLDQAAGIQKLHTVPTSRIGGLAIAAGLLVALQNADSATYDLLQPMAIAALPAFAAGLLEDTTKAVNVTWRLLATMASGLLAWALTDIAMQDTGLWGLDILLSWLPLGVAFTAFVVSGVANATNIIDGFNGLAGGVVIVMLLAMYGMALQVGDLAVATVALLAVASTLGFLVLNWPLGKIFMGDGGAYMLGFIVAWIAILLPMRHEQINGWATLLACAYPVIEVLYSIRRRIKRAGHHPGAPDVGHLHHFIYRRVVRKLFRGRSRSLQNGLTGMIGWGLASVPATWATVFYDNTVMLVAGFALAVFGYVALYARLTQFVWCFQAATLSPDRSMHA